MMEGVLERAGCVNELSNDAKRAFFIFVKVKILQFIMFLSKRENRRER